MKGEILANLWDRPHRAHFAANRPSHRLIDLSHLYPQQERPSREAVLNGIAYDAVQDVLIVTGKHWPKLYVIPAP